MEKFCREFRSEGEAEGTFTSSAGIKSRITQEARFGESVDISESLGLEVMTEYCRVRLQSDPKIQSDPEFIIVQFHKLGVRVNQQAQI